MNTYSEPKRVALKMCISGCCVYEQGCLFGGLISNSWLKLFLFYILMHIHRYLWHLGSTSNSCSCHLTQQPTCVITAPTCKNEGVDVGKSQRLPPLPSHTGTLLPTAQDVPLGVHHPSMSSLSCNCELFLLCTVFPTDQLRKHKTHRRNINI